MPVTHEERMSIMSEIVVWLKAAPTVTYMGHSTTNGVGLAQRERPMFPSELASELERQIETGTA